MEVISICLVEQLDDQGSQLFCWWLCFLKDRQPDPGNHGILAHWRKTDRQLQWRKTSGTFRSCSASQIVAFESGNEDISFFFESASMENTAPLNRCLSNSAECNNYSFRTIQIISNHSKSIWPKTGMVIKTGHRTSQPTWWSRFVVEQLPSARISMATAVPQHENSCWRPSQPSCLRCLDRLENGWDDGRSWKIMEDHGRWLKDLDVDFTCWKSPANSWLENLWRSLKVWTWIFFVSRPSRPKSLWDSPTEACDLHLRVGLRSAFLETIPCSASKGPSWGPEGSRPFRRSPCIRWSHW